MSRAPLPLAIALASCAHHDVNHDTRTKTMTQLQMQLDVKGTGAPLVLVGGGLTGWDSWVPHQQQLASTRQVLRGQPLTVQYGLENAKMPDGYSIRMESRALAAALDARGLTGQIDLVGWSFGGVISLDFALEHPDRIRTLTLIEPPAFWVLDAAGTRDAESTRESDELRAPRPQMKDDVTEAQLAAFVRLAGLVPPGKQPEQLPQWPSWVDHRRSLRTQEAEWRHRDDAARLRAFGKPVLLVKGTGSTHFLHRIIDGLAATLPHATVIELPGGHAPQLVAMNDFLVRLAAFQEQAR